MKGMEEKANRERGQLKHRLVQPEKEGNLTKAEKKQLKLQKNQEWMHKYRSNGIEQDELNPRYSLYYQRQLKPYFENGLDESVSESADWKAFLQAFRQPLPVVFRISQRCPPFLRHSIQIWLKERFPHHEKLFLDHDIVEANMKLIEWSPFTYQLSFDNSILLNQPKLKEVNQFLAAQCQAGYIIRQELVSMIPVLFLDVQYSHTILDCCAAPGSKTEQILAAMDQSYRVAKYKNPQLTEASLGCLVANDTDQKRIQELLQKFARFPSWNILFTNMNGERFSSYFLPPHSTPSSPSSSSLTTISALECFDRILCDVPCSGDGTFRKAPHLWRLFRPRTGIDFHLLQKKILLQAVLLLKPGGRLVYSTCSLNPLEDEAVVAAVLTECGLERLQLVDCSQHHRSLCQEKGLHSRAGLSSWSAHPETFLVGESEAEQRQTAKRMIHSLPESLHPPEAQSPLALEQLPRCLRIFPQDQNTGGFFIAVLEKRQSFSLDLLQKHLFPATNTPLPPPASSSSTQQSLIINPTQQSLTSFSPLPLPR